MRSALHLDLERFFSASGRADLSVHPSAFTKARAHLKASAFIELNETLLENFPQQADSIRKAPRFLAIDGTTLRLPNTPAMQVAFGGQQGLAMARVSVLYDLRTQFIIAGKLSPYGVGENEQAMDLIGARIGLGDCIVIDRGFYNDYFLFAWTMAHGADFLVRIPTKGNNRVEKFLASGKSEENVEQELPEWIMEEMRAMGMEIERVIKLRMLRVELKSGETEVLLSTLLDRKLHPAEEFGKYYHQRWGIEECYKRLKCYIEPENWTGKSVWSVEQDFHASILQLNLARVAAYMAQPIMEEKMKQGGARKWAYAINLKRACAALRDGICAILTAPEEERSSLLGAILLRITKAPVPIRPGRSYPRHHKRRQPPSFAYKPI